ncbi:MAG: lysostaphin resistance A-like protein [Planctomycetaceae bacterium]
MEILSDLLLLLQIENGDGAAAMPGAEELTPTRIVAGLMVMAAGSASFAVGISWIKRFLRGVPLLQQSKRRIFAVPFGLTAAILIFSIALVGLVLATTFSETGEIDSPRTPTTATADSEAGDPDESVIEPTDNGAIDDREVSPIPDAEAEEMARNIVVQTVGMNLVLMLCLGLAMYLRRHAPRFDPQTQQLDTDVTVPSAESWSELVAADVEDPAEVGGDKAVRSADEAASLNGVSVREELLVAGEVALVVYLPTMILRLLMVFLMTKVTGEVPGNNPLLEILQTEAGQKMMLMIGVAAVFMAPLAEELQFRVVILGGLLRTNLARFAPAITALLFGMAHGIPDGIALLPLAFVLGYTYLQRRSYLTVVLVHLLFNLFNVLLAILVLV